jgi:hypothetical protein
MLLEGLSELRSEYGFFFPRLHPIAQDDQADSRDAMPFVNRQGSADRGENDSGIKGMAEMSVGASTDQLVVLFESDAGAPKLSQVPASPQSESDANPGECDAGDGNSVCPRDNEVSENADVPSPGEEQDKAGYFQKEEDGTRHQGFVASDPARPQRAYHQVCAKD